MLPDDTKARRLEANEKTTRQSQVNEHFQVAELNEASKKVEPFSQERFKQAAVQWMIETDQVCYLCLTTLRQTI